MIFIKILVNDIIKSFARRTDLTTMLWNARQNRPYFSTQIMYMQLNIAFFIYLYMSEQIILRIYGLMGSSH